MTTRKQRMGARLGLAGGLIALASWGTAVGVSDYAENRTMTEDARYVMDIDGDHAAQEDPAVKARYDSLKALPWVQATISEYKTEKDVAFALIVLGFAGCCAGLPGAMMYLSEDRREEEQ